MQQRFDIRPADVFISFTGADREIKNKIAQYLELKNIICLESDKDCCGNYRQWSIEAPEHCSIFLPIITENVVESSIMKDEYDAMLKTYEALKEQDRGDFFNRIVAVSTNFETYKKHSFGMHENVSAIWDEKLPGDIGEETLERIYENIRKLLIHIECRRKYNPGRSSEFFRGRDSEIQKLGEILDDFNTVFVYGIGGIGKTELAKKFAEHHITVKSSFFNVIYLRYRDNPEKDGVSPLESIINSVTDEMSAATKKEIFHNPETLVILDNFDVEDDKYLDEFLSFNCKKIITTRNKGFCNFENAAAFEVGALNDEAQHALFCAHYGYDVDKNDENLKFILNAVAGITIFIPIIAKQCLSAKMDLKDMCQKLTAGGISTLKNDEKLTAYKDEALLKGNTLEIARIIFKTAGLDESSKKALRNLSMIQFMHVNADMYREICSQEKSGGLNALNYLAENCWIIERRDSLSPKNNTFELHPIIKELVKTDLKPTVENCPEVWEYAQTFYQTEESFFHTFPNIIKLVRYGMGAPLKSLYETHDLQREFSYARLGLWCAFLNEADFENEVNYKYLVRMEKDYDKRQVHTFLRIREYLNSVGMNALTSSYTMSFLADRIKEILLKKETFNSDDMFLSAMLLGVKEIAEDVDTVKKLAEKCYASRKKIKNSVRRRFAEKLFYAASEIMTNADSRNDCKHTIYLELLKKFRKYLSPGMKLLLKINLKSTDSFLEKREYWYAERDKLKEKVNSASTIEEALKITDSLWRRLDRIYFFSTVIFPRFLRKDMTSSEAEAMLKAFSRYYEDNPLCDPEFDLDESYDLRSAFIISYTARELDSLSFDAVYNFLIEMRANPDSAVLAAAAICNDKEKGEKALREYLYRKPPSEKTSSDIFFEAHTFPVSEDLLGEKSGFDAYADLLFSYTDEITQVFGKEKEYEMAIIEWHSILGSMFKDEANKKIIYNKKRNYMFDVAKTQ